MDGKAENAVGEGGGGGEGAFRFLLLSPPQPTQIPNISG